METAVPSRNRLAHHFHLLRLLFLYPHRHCSAAVLLLLVASSVAAAAADD